MGIMQATTSAERRAEWLLDRIRRGQFANLSSCSVEDLKSLEQETVRAYEALPPSRETDRGRVMLLQGRVRLELRNRELSKKPNKAKPTARRGATAKARKRRAKWRSASAALDRIKL